MVAFVSGWSVVGRRSVTGSEALCRKPLAGTRSRRSQVVNMVAGTETLDEAWKRLATQMREKDETASLEEWNGLVQVAVDGDDLERAVYFVDLMKKTGQNPQASTYDIILEKCSKKVATREKEIAFHLVEQMYKDNISLGDVELPGDLEQTLRALLPPEAFQ